MILSINSRKNSFVKNWLSLRDNRKVRFESKTVFLEGKKTIVDLHKHKKINTLISTSKKFLTQFDAEKKFLITEEIANKISTTTTPEGFFAEIDLPPQSTLSNLKKLLILDGLQDPGNLGTLFRTALSLGWDAVFCLNSCVDVFNDKALRASKGAPFLLPFLYGNENQLQLILDNNNMTLLSADIRGEKCTLQKRGNIALALGNESRGPSEFIKLNSEKMKIEQSTLMESLNVAVAGGILMYNLNNVGV